MAKFGNIAIFSRLPTADERARLHADAEARTERISQARRAGQQRYREAQEAAREDYIEALYAQDGEKVPLLERDHAEVTVDDRVYYLPLDSRYTIIAARALGTLSHYKAHQRIKLSDIIGRTWDAMTLDERRLFADDEKKVLSKKAPIGLQVAEALRKLTNRMGATHEPSGDIFIVDAPIHTYMLRQTLLARRVHAGYGQPSHPGRMKNGYLNFIVTRFRSNT